jgi:archaellum biogenesis ATPase FlaH
MKVVLVIISKKDYQKKIDEVVKLLDKVGKKISYVSMNTPYRSIIISIANLGLDLDKFFFIDSSTSLVRKPEKADNCIFVSSPGNLKEIGSAFAKSLDEYKCNASIFDSLSTLLIYEKPHAVIQFVHYVTVKARTANSKVYFVVLREDMDMEFMKDLYMFADRSIELN